MKKRGKKVSIIGAGNVGSTVAYSLAMQGTAHEIVLIDNKDDIARGKALDMSQAAAVVRSHTVVKVAKDESDIAGSDIVVVTAGSARKPGMSRDDLLMINATVMKSVMEYVKKYAPDSIIIVVTNPLDVMTYVALKESGFEPSKVLGMAGILDGARMASFIYQKLGYGAGQIRATVMGGHGDTMVPLESYSTVAGVPLTDIMSKEDIAEIIEKTKHGGAEIVKYLQTGSAYYAPAKATALMCEAILKDAKQIYPCSAYLDGQYGYTNVYSGVPIVLGANGVEEILEVTLSNKEAEMFANSVHSVENMIKTLEQNNFFN
ncbi:MAG: malate dehydrogenase [Campylobacterota bacterium]|nr:malate dehydrogenase [Campylobacterota bacterium]